LGTLAVCTLLFFLVAGGFLALGVDSLETFGEAVSMGRDDGDDPSSFTGRIPLWEYAIEDILERPILGHGIGSYWSDEQLEDAHHELEWALPDAHNGYIEISLALGITGLFLALLVTALGMKSIGRQEVRSFDRGLAAIFGLCTFGLLNASFESHMSQAFNFTPFVVNCVFCRLAFFPEPRFERQENPEVEFHHEDVAWEASLN
jgi:O-antigen ligase